VVAETLRPLFEPQAVDRLPLPSDSSQLFELVCLVRVLRTLVPRPTHIRWLDTQANRREIAVPGITCTYQYGIARDQMIASPEFGYGLRSAVVRHNVGAPRYIDALFTFDPPRLGFGAALLEAKSGLQDYRAAVFQLKCYSAVLRQRLQHRLIAWGVFEREPDGAASVGQALDSLAKEMTVEQTADVWLFTHADAINDALAVMGLRASAQPPPN
jgi:hypothetical protein